MGFIRKSFTSALIKTQLPYLVFPRPMASRELALPDRRCHRKTAATMPFKRKWTAM
jgi:hypothetical protein